MKTIRVEKHCGQDEDIARLNQVIGTWETDCVYYDIFGHLQFRAGGEVIRVKNNDAHIGDWYKIYIVESGE